MQTDVTERQRPDPLTDAMIRQSMIGKATECHPRVDDRKLRLDRCEVENSSVEPIGSK